jgi:hypothetical protein
MKTPNSRGFESPRIEPVCEAASRYADQVNGCQVSSVSDGAQSSQVPPSKLSSTKIVPSPMRGVIPSHFHPQAVSNNVCTVCIHVTSLLDPTSHIFCVLQPRKVQNFIKRPGPSWTQGDSPVKGVSGLEPCKIDLRQRGECKRSV